MRTKSYIRDDAAVATENDALQATRPRLALPNSSVVFGITLPADLEDVLAILRAATVVAKTLKLGINVEIETAAADPFRFRQAPSPAPDSSWLEPVKARLQRIGSRPGFVLETNVVAASFVSEGMIWMRIRSANSDDHT